MTRKRTCLALLVIAGALILSGCETPPVRPTEIPPFVPPTRTGAALEPTATAVEGQIQPLLGVTAARDKALAFVRERYPEQAPQTELDWVERRMTPEGLVSAETFQYTTEDWIVTMSYPVVAPELTVYRVVLANETTGFRWEGSVDAAGTVSEVAQAATEPSDPVLAARDAALAFLSDEYGEETPGVEVTWTRARTTPENVVGSESYEYRAGHWIVSVSYAVVAPEATRYRVVASNQSTGLQWEGEVGPSGDVTEVRPRIVGQPAIGWYGRVITLPEGAQFDDYLVVEPEGTGQVGLTGADASTEAEIEALRDTGTYAHFWGTLTSDVPDYKGYQLVVTRLRADRPGPQPEPDPIEAWQGTIATTSAMAQYDDYFTLKGDFPIRYGIDSGDAALAAQLESLRDTGAVVSVWGRLTCGTMDVNGCQIGVIAIAVDEMPAAPVPAAVNAWVGTVFPLPAGSEYDDYFEREDGQRFGIDSTDADMQHRIAAVRIAGVPVRIWGQLLPDAPDVEGRQILVERYELVTESSMVEGWVGSIGKLEAGAQYDDYFERDDGQRYGIETSDPKLTRRLETLREEGARVRIWGELLSDVPDVEGRQIRVTEVELME